MADLAGKKCIPCQGDIPPLKGAAIEDFHAQLDPGWEVVDEHHLEKQYKFRDFRGALDFTIQLGEVAEEEGHHPDIYLAWGFARVTIWTHKIDGLAESDFFLAAKTDRVFKKMGGKG